MFINYTRLFAPFSLCLWLPRDFFPSLHCHYSNFVTTTNSSALRLRFTNFHPCRVCDWIFRLSSQSGLLQFLIWACILLLGSIRRQPFGQQSGFPRTYPWTGNRIRFWLLGSQERRFQWSFTFVQLQDTYLTDYSAFSFCAQHHSFCLQHPEVVWHLHLNADPEGPSLISDKPDKEKSTEKIDGVVATIMALDRALRHNGEDRSVFDGRGLLIL